MQSVPPRPQGRNKGGTKAAVERPPGRPAQLHRRAGLHLDVQLKLRQRRPRELVPTGAPGRDESTTILSPSARIFRSAPARTILAERKTITRGRSGAASGATIDATSASLSNE